MLPPGPEVQPENLLVPSAEVVVPSTEPVILVPAFEPAAEQPSIIFRPPIVPEVGVVPAPEGEQQPVVVVIITGTEGLVLAPPSSETETTGPLVQPPAGETSPIVLTPANVTTIIVTPPEVEQEGPVAVVVPSGTTPPRTESIVEGVAPVVNVTVPIPPAVEAVVPGVGGLNVTTPGNVTVSETGVNVTVSALPATE